MTDWSIVVPFRAAGAKSRFGSGDNSALALAMALDTVDVALRVGRVIVVTSDARPFVKLGASVIADPGAGLNAAIALGLDHAGLDTAGLDGLDAVFDEDSQKGTSIGQREGKRRFTAAQIDEVRRVLDAHPRLSDPNLILPDIYSR